MITDEDLRAFSGKSALVTGGTGLIGRQVVDLLCDAGAQVRIVSLDRLRVHPRADHVIGDLSDLALCTDLTKGVDYVFHLAGVPGSVGVAAETRLASHFVPTLMMNTNVLEAARRNKVEKLVYTSSIGAYARSAEVFVESSEEPGGFSGPPMDFAGWAKRMAELQIHAYKVQYGMENYAIVRPANVYGPGDNFDPQSALVIPSLISRIFRGDDPLVIWGDGTAVRDFVFSRDVAEGCLLALLHGTGAHFVNLGSGTGVSIRELVETLGHIVDFRFEFDPSKPSGFPKRVMDIGLSARRIHYNPTTSLRSGLAATWEWFVKNHDEHLRKQNYFRETTA
jgi:GDP-L-fucose synthase